MEKGACASVFVLRDSPEYMGFLAPGCTFGVPRVRSFSEYRPGPVLLPESFCFPFGAAQGGLSRVDHPMLLFFFGVGFAHFSREYSSTGG